MNELAKHIEILLLDNDCVILPGFGGFIAHSIPAGWNSEENSFTPPYRSIGFNPQLTLNDGVLTQSFMAAYHTNFPDAERIVNQKIRQLTEQLYAEGSINLYPVGTLNYSVEGKISFTPSQQHIQTPSLYGLGSFEIKELCQLEKTVEKTLQSPVLVPDTPRKEHHIPYLREAVAVAVAILLFFLLSKPVENTDVQQLNYAQLIPSGIFEIFDREPLAMTLVEKNNDRTGRQNARPKVVKEVKVNKTKPEITNKETAEAIPVPAVVSEPVPVAPAQKAEVTPQPAPTAPEAATIKSSKPYKIIVASVSQEQEAAAMVRKLQTEGYKEAEVVKGDGRIRVSILAYQARKEANKNLNLLREVTPYTTAWLLVTP
ncbi:MAG: SPOR domain-containing protein [Bacteroides sp.]|nr:SPOR domain-containing protein [Bacteroides sp.]